MPNDKHSSTTFLQNQAFPRHRYALGILERIETAITLLHTTKGEQN